MYNFGGVACIFLSLVLGQLAIAALVSAVTQIYVSPFGSDLNDGSEMKPVQTIERSIELSSANGFVFLAVGSYRLAGPDGIRLKKNLTFQAKDTTTLPDLHTIICAKLPQYPQQSAFKVEKSVSLTLNGIAIHSCMRNIYLYEKAHLTARNVEFKTNNVAIWRIYSADQKSAGGRLTVDNSTFYAHDGAHNTTAIMFENFNRAKPWGGRVATIRTSTFESLQVFASRGGRPTDQEETVTFVDCVMNGPRARPDWGEAARPLFDLENRALRLIVNSTAINAYGLVADIDAVKEFTILGSTVLGVADTDEETDAVLTAVRVVGDKEYTRQRWQVNLNGTIVRFFDRVVECEGLASVNVWNSTLADNGVSTKEDEENHMVFHLNGESILTIDKSILFNNTGKEAGVIYATNEFVPHSILAQFHIRDSTFKGNTATHTGGVFRCVLAASGTVLSSTFADNSAGEGGASIGSCDESCHATIRDNDLNQNTNPEFEHCN